MSRMSLNESNQTVNFGYEVATYLSKTEFKLLKVLHDNEGALVDRNEVLISIWGEANVWNARSMDVYICKLRKILKPHYKIVNIHGKGHVLQKS